MAVAGFDAATVVELDEIAIAAIVEAGRADNAVGGGVDRGAHRAGEIDPHVPRDAAAEGIGAGAVARGERGDLDRLFRRDGDRADLEIVELLPAGEKLLEGHVAVLADRLERAALT